MIPGKMWELVDDFQDRFESGDPVAVKGKVGEFYNIGSNYNLDNLSVVKKLINVSKRKIKIGSNVKIKFVKDRPGHDKRYAINSSKIKNKIGWKPKINFEEGLKKTFSWYHKNQQYYSKLNKKDITKRIGVKK